MRQASDDITKHLISGLQTLRELVDNNQSSPSAGDLDLGLEAFHPIETADPRVSDIRMDSRAKGDVDFKVGVDRL